MDPYRSFLRIIDKIDAPSSFSLLYLKLDIIIKHKFIRLDNLANSIKLEVFREGGNLKDGPK